MQRIYQKLETAMPDNDAQMLLIYVDHILYKYQSVEQNAVEQNTVEQVQDMNDKQNPNDKKYPPIDTII